jgi:predicted Zn finger-like uncharacterized protein
MIITCPNCATKFRLDEGRIPEEGSQARCSLCQHIFPVRKTGQPESTRPPIIIPELIDERAALRKHSRGRPSFLVISSICILIFIFGAIVLMAGDKYDDLEKWVSFSTIKQYLGVGEEKEGKINLDKLRGYYAENNTLGRIFVIEGNAINQWTEPRSFIRIKGTLLDVQGRKIQERTVYCGNIISEKDLREMSKEAIQKSLASQFGISFSNMNLAPGKFVPFMIVFTDWQPETPAPKPPPEKAGEASADLSDFTVEVISSQRGSKAK